MKKNKLLIFFLSFFLIILNSHSEIIVLSKCDHKEDKYLKNEYIFNLNKKGKWYNGDPVNASDFVWSWMRLLTASLGSQYPDMHY